MAGTVHCADQLAGLLPKETLILVDGKRVAFGSLGVAGSSQGQDINLIPFPMIDHIDILKDGASAVYGSDCCYRSGQLLFNPQVPWSGDRGQLWKHKLGSIQ